MAGLFITAEPQIFGINTDDDSNTADESTSARILWPLCFALGFLPIGLMNVICEKELKGGEVCIIYFHLLIHTYITWLKHITQILKYFLFYRQNHSTLSCGPNLPKSFAWCVYFGQILFQDLEWYVFIFNLFFNSFYQ